jgi:hypothetical protein
MAFWILIGADVLMFIGLTIKLRNRSPYSNVPLLDDQTRSRLRIGQFVLLAGFVCGLIGYAVRYWRQGLR